eukprot:TRINITY_DN11892_c0_g1_i1.p1 TRINITY_DN11892_c0_g1~~TRINITY_DN11892_c0_g1_i1.p1  ORF type:complete len:868 (+),score=184.03 TRINITY_DN11892_c0_g1_i1:78-2681(+)
MRYLTLIVLFLIIVYGKDLFPPVLKQEISDEHIPLLTTLTFKYDNKLTLLDLSVNRFLEYVFLHETNFDIDTNANIDSKLDNNLDPDSYIDKCYIKVAKYDEVLAIGTNVSFSIEIDNNQCFINSSTVFGSIYALNMLQQLVSPSYDVALIPKKVFIQSDEKKPWRAIRYDISSFYMSFLDIEELLTTLSMARINILLLTISSSSNVAIEGHFKNSFGQQYSSNDFHDLADEALRFGIMVVPSFSFPCNIKSWNLTYPSLVLDSGIAETSIINPLHDDYLTAIQEFVKLVDDAFPRVGEHYIHIDSFFPEAALNVWKNNTNITKYIEENSLTFGKFLLDQINTLLNNLGRTKILTLGFFEYTKELVDYVDIFEILSEKQKDNLDYLLSQGLNIIDSSSSKLIKSATVQFDRNMINLNISSNNKVIGSTIYYGDIPLQSKHLSRSSYLYHYFPSSFIILYMFYDINNLNNGVEYAEDNRITIINEFVCFLNAKDIIISPFGGYSCNYKEIQSLIDYVFPQIIETEKPSIISIIGNNFDPLANFTKIARVPRIYINNQECEILTISKSIIQFKSPIFLKPTTGLLNFTIYNRPTILMNNAFSIINPFAPFITGMNIKNIYPAIINQTIELFIYSQDAKQLNTEDYLIQLALDKDLTEIFSCVEVIIIDLYSIKCILPKFSNVGVLYIRLQSTAKSEVLSNVKEIEILALDQPKLYSIFPSKLDLPALRSFELTIYGEYLNNNLNNFVVVKDLNITLFKQGRTFGKCHGISLIEQESFQVISCQMIPNDHLSSEFNENVARNFSVIITMNDRIYFSNTTINFEKIDLKFNIAKVPAIIIILVFSLLFAYSYIQYQNAQKNRKRAVSSLIR